MPSRHSKGFDQLTVGVQTAVVSSDILFTVSSFTSPLALGKSTATRTTMLYWIINFYPNVSWNYTKL